MFQVDYIVPHHKYEIIGGVHVSRFWKNMIVLSPITEEFKIIIKKEGQNTLKKGQRLQNYTLCYL